MTGRPRLRLVLPAVVLALAASTGSVLAHSYPKTSDPAANARLDRPPAHIAITGEDLLDTHPSGDGGWVLDGNEIAVPGDWRAVMIVRRTDVVDDAMGTFDFTVDTSSGVPQLLKETQP